MQWWRKRRLGARGRGDLAVRTHDIDPRAYRLDDTLRMDQIQVLGSHNSYHGRPYPQVLAALYKSTPALARTLDYAHAPLPQQFDIGVRQIELDVWSDPLGGKYAKPSFPIQEGVKIPDNPVMRRPGFKVIHQADVDTNSTCLTFVSCIRLVKTWSDAHPSHVPIDIHVEMKDDKATEPLFAELEKEILSVFPRNEIITPDDVRANAPTLGAAVRARTAGRRSPRCAPRCTSLSTTRGSAPRTWTGIRRFAAGCSSHRRRPDKTTPPTRS